MTTVAQRHREQLISFRDGVLVHLVIHQSDDPTPFYARLFADALQGIVDDLTAAIDGACPEDPMRLAGAPLGMYHCPLCGCMLVAGVPYHPHDDGCRLGLNDEDG